MYFPPGSTNPHSAQCAALSGESCPLRPQLARTERTGFAANGSAFASNESFFEAVEFPGVFHQRRCSTADKSGLQDCE